jgi:serine protease AprX
MDRSGQPPAGHVRLRSVGGRRAGVLVIALVLSVVVVSGPAVGIPARGVGGRLESSHRPIGLSRLLAGHPADAVTRGIATFDAVPRSAQVRALKALGLTVQPMKHLPLALLRGPVAAMARTVTAGIANDVYPEERIELLDRASADAMGAAKARKRGLTGKGVTVAVVDSGCDGSHPDLADHVIHNVKLISAEYLNIYADSSNTIVVPIHLLPYNNSDLGSGHGTHVAGIIAADGTASPDHLGVAPDADLVCLGIGEILFTTAVVTAYDYLLDQPNMLGVDVINNSWGNSFRQFDPRDPVHVATRAVTAAGAIVVFAAGNSGSENAEMSLNPFSHAPWVISVAAGTLDHHRGDFSSNGLQFDNALPVSIPAGGHSAFTGDRIGMYHPDVTAPGVDISSTCDSAGTPAVIGPCPPGENATASGTSMASPHVAGAVAVLVQAKPNLTTTQARAALQATATPVAGPKKGSRLTLWQIGYGYVNLSSAVDLVRSAGLSRAKDQADRRIQKAARFTVPRSDFWTYDAPRVAIGGTDHRVFEAKVPKSITHLKVTLSHPSLAVVGANEMQYDVEVRDAAGRLLGVTQEAELGAGTASLLLNLRSVRGLKYGVFRFDVIGLLAVSDPDTLDSESLLGRMVTLQVAQLRVKK